MLKTDRWTGVFFILLSAYVCRESLHLGLGSVHSPGPGFLSFWSGLVFGLMALVLVTKSLLKTGSVGEGYGNWTGATLVFFSLFGFLLILDKVGFILSAFLLTLFLLRIVERRRWWVSLAVSCLAALGTYFIFEVLLRAELPRGIFNF